ncbi:MAG: TIGR02453 family protein [Planctomycetota bacterium]
MARAKKNTLAENTATFEGFPKATFRFLRSLERNNNRDWFQNNRGHYEDFFLNPALSFINAMQPVLSTTAPLLVADARKTGGSLMRIYRDTRFSKEKTPYKTNIGIQFRHQSGRDVHAPGIYMHIDSEQCFLGAGMWKPPSDAIRMIRLLIEDSPKRWSRLLQRKGFRQSFELFDDRLKTAPRGFAKDHPMIDDLRLKSFVAMTNLSQAEVQSPQLISQTTKLIKAARPLMEFLCESVGQPY